MQLSSFILLASFVFPPTYGQSSLLRMAASFGVLGASTVKNTHFINVNGNAGVSLHSAITSSSPRGITNGVEHLTDAVAAQAQSDALTTYNSLASPATTTVLTGEDLGRKTLVAGTYKFSSTAGLIGTVTLDGQGKSDGLWVFQIGTPLTTATASSVLLINGAQPHNVFWQVGSSATLGTQSVFNGYILSTTSMYVDTNSTTNKGFYALNAQVTLDTTTIGAESCGGGNGGGCDGTGARGDARDDGGETGGRPARENRQIQASTGTAQQQESSIATSSAATPATASGSAAAYVQVTSDANRKPKQGWEWDISFGILVLTTGYFALGPPI